MVKTITDLRGRQLMQQKHSTLAPFRIAIFRNLWSATLISNLGGLIQGVGASWLMVSLTTSSALVSLVQAANTLPIVILSLVAGALADNFNRRRIMILSQLCMMFVSAALAVLTLCGWMTPPLLLLFTFLIGCCGAVYNPPWQATVGDIVPREQISSAVTLNSVGFNLMRSVGPAVGGGIVATWGSAIAFICNAFSYIPLLGALLFWKPTYKKSRLPRERLVGAMSDGLRYVMMSPHIINIMVRAFLFGCGAISILSLLPLVARDELGGNAQVFGILLGFFGVGAILGGVINAWVRERFMSETIVVFSFIGFAFSCLFLGLSSSSFLSYIMLLPAGMCWVLALSLFNTTVQLSTPRWVVSRALALYQTSSFGGMALGSWLWGSLADGYGTKMALVICAVFLMIGAVAGLKFRIYEIPSINLEPNDQFREPELRLDLKARSGPIMIMIDYEISEADLPRFLKLMQIRRRHRIRDGARNWALLRDLENPECWTESYGMSTWVDYLRHNHRRMQEDVDLIDKLRKLNRAPQGVRVHRMIERNTVPHVDEMHLKPPAEPPV